MTKILMIVMITSAFLFSFQSQDQPSENEINLKKLHWIIERSPIPVVKEKFDEIIRETGLPQSANQLNDGKYYGESPYDDYGYKHIISFEVKDGRIDHIDYNEIKEDGHGKQEDAVYAKSMSASGTTPAIAYPIYEKQLSDKQQFDQLDAVTGATYSMYRFKLAVAYAILEKVKN